ncbi:hypothetical protein N9K33_04685 [Planktomarina temperata]|nr:hypothetical protein [Planktomarina temperata]
MARLTDQDKKLIAEVAGFKVINEPLEQKRSKPSMYLRCQCLKCGSRKDCRVEHLKTKEIECKICTKQEVIEKAKAMGLAYLGLPAENHSKKTDYFRFKFVSCSHEQDFSRSSIRNMYTRCAEIQNFQNKECSVCAEHRYSQEAKDKGLLKVSGPLKGGYREYKPINCEHRLRRHPIKIKEIIDKYECEKCRWISWQEQASKKGLQLLKKAKAGKCRYEFLNGFEGCKHTIDLTPAKVRSKIERYMCEDCEMNLLAKQSKRGKISWINNVKGKKGIHCWRFKNCGHYQEIAKQAVKNNQFHCSICHDEKLKREADEHGYILLGDASNGKVNYKRYRHKKCGQDADYALSNMRLNSYCQHCEKSSWNDQSNVYLLELSYLGNDTLAAKTWLKLGHAKDLQKRIEQYGLPTDLSISHDIKIIEVIETESRYEASNLETTIGSSFRDYRLKEQEMKEYHKQSGASECYESVVKNKIKSKMVEQNILYDEINIK